MSHSTRSSRADRLAAAACTLIVAASIAVARPALAAFDAPPLPPAIAALAPSLKAQGGGELRYFGFHVYDGWYWSPVRGFSLEHPLALDLHYKRSLDGHAIAARSVDEIAKLGLGTPEQRARWGEAMRGLFPDVARGDRLTGVSLPPGRARFFHNGRPIGEIDDREFARAFFGIWLDPRTSRPDYRKRLLGEPE
jgi:hypothetical protein